MKHINGYTVKLLLCFIFLVGSLKGQELPFLKNYLPSDYQAARQNWSLGQGENDILYAGNDQGLLRYDGGNWKLYKLKEGKSIRSLLNHKSRIYTGAFGEFGYWTEVSGGELMYTSLNHLINEKNFSKEEIWNILPYGNDVYFQSFGMLFKYDGNTVIRIPIPGTVMFLAAVNQQLYLPVIGKGLFTFENNSWKLLQGSQQLGSLTVTAILPWEKSIMICTQEDGAYLLEKNKVIKWRHPINDVLSRQQINKAMIVRDRLYSFATINGGVYIINLDTGEIIEINTRTGLQNNTVLSQCKDRNAGLWFGLDKGLSYFSLSKSMLFYDSKKDNLGTIYTAEIFNGNKYAGTNQGLYVWKGNRQTGREQNAYVPVYNIKGQVWHLLRVKEGLICAHNAGCDLITETGIQPLFRGTGCWFTMQHPDNDKVLIQGSYNGLLVYTYDGTWKFSHKIEKTAGAIDRIIYFKDNKYWLTGPGGELQKIQLNDNYTEVVTRHVYTGTSNLGKSRRIDMAILNDIFQIKLKDSLYTYNEARDRFDFTKPFQGTLHGPFDKYYCEVFRDSVAFISGKERNTLFIKPSQEKNVVTEWGADHWLVLMEEGYVLIEKKIFNNRSFQPANPLVIDYVQSGSGKKYFPENGKISLEYEDRTFTVYFHEAAFAGNNHYSFQLSGRDSIRGKWENQSSFQVFNLNYGNYDLKVYSSSGQSAGTLLEVSPPWYFSVHMRVVYLILFLLAAAGFWYVYTNELKKSKQKIIQENERLLREHKIALDNQKLMEENRQKSQEIANSTMQLIKKNELLLEIKDELVELRKTNEGLSQKEFQKMMRQINENITSEHDNKLFEANFHEIHEVFFKKLLATYPNLTSQDLKLAAYLKMNLTTKEIAPLFNITVRGLENKRYRLRMKLNLPPETNLSEFFIAFE